MSVSTAGRGCYPPGIEGVVQQYIQILDGQGEFSEQISGRFVDVAVMDLPRDTTKTLTQRHLVVAVAEFAE